MTKSLAIVYGGVSVEHEISIRSASTVFEKLDRSKYSVILLYVDKMGNWTLNPKEPSQLDALRSIHLNLQPGKALFSDAQGVLYDVDVFFPLMHGTFGEDGSVQGLFRLIQRPFVGPDLQSSAVCMNKLLSKKVLELAGVPIAAFVEGNSDDNRTELMDRINSKLSYPIIVKPINLGSSVGVSKVSAASELRAALEDVFKFDSDALIEEFIVGRELECSIKGNEVVQASGAGEVIIDKSKYEFYDYTAKYDDPNGAKTEIPARIEPSILENIKIESIKAYKALDCEVMARIDLFLANDGRIIINEINSIPGFTDISMYAKLWEQEGISYSDLLDELIGYAEDRFLRKQALETSYQ